MSDEQGETTIYPAWREALKQWPARGHTWGDLLGHEDLYAMFGLEMANDRTPFKEAETLKLKFLNQFQPFKRALLEEHRMDLVSVPGLGYEIIAPDVQAPRAYDDTVDKIRKALDDGARRIRFVPTGMLSDEARRQNADLMARTAMLAGMFRGRERLSLDGEAE